VRISTCVNINDIIRPDLRMLGKVKRGGGIAWKAIESKQRAIDKFDTRTTEGEEATAGKEVESMQGAPSSMV
jgi:glutamate-1-semialdehyde aminotransferase